MTRPIRIGYFSTGVADPSQGGSGNINYHILRYLLAEGYEVHSFFRVTPDFVKSHSVPAYMQELVDKGLRAVYVQTQESPQAGQTGIDFLLANHQTASCRQMVRNLKEQLATFSTVIAFDLGWVVALGETGIPAVGLLGDPVEVRLFHTPSPEGPPEQVLPFTHARFAVTQSMVGMTSAVLSRLGPSMRIGTFSPAHVPDVQVPGLVECRHFPYFVSAPAAWQQGEQPVPKERGRLEILHVGDLGTTASSNMVRYWRNQVMPALAGLDFPITIRMVGRAGAGNNLGPTPPNVTAVYLGHVEDITTEFLNADLYLSIMHYPVGVRTRVVTAMSYGIPIIADVTVARGLPELTHGRDIFYAAAPDALADLLKRAYHEPKKVRRVGAAARRMWETRFNPEINVPKIVEALFEPVAAGRKEPA